jgi:hypothetical protein
MKNIHTLIPDIYELLKTKGWYDGTIRASFEAEISSRLASSFNQPQEQGKLRLSQLGPRCPRAFWYSIHEPGVAEPLPPWATFKYSYGHIIEALVIALAKAAGHEVTGEQDALTLDGVVGHRDCVIDGCIVDIKSASSIGFKKIRDGQLAVVDDFGYLDQLDGYIGASDLDPLVVVKNKGYILAVDKTLGHFALYEHKYREENIKRRITECKRIAELSNPPACECRSRQSGSSGNMELDVKASYNPYKWSCNPSLRCFLYADGPRYLTKVIRKPDVKEIDKYGKVCYN